jgi:hypothetical protein
MNKLIILFTAFFISANILVFADQAEQVITLKDGSQIKGVLSGIENGVYTVKTPIIGDVHVAASDVSSITNGNAAPAAINPPAASTAPNQALGSIPNLDQQIATNQQKLISNPQSMAMLQEMAQDPEIMQALQDPAVLQAVTSHDYQAIANNPKIQALMNNPKMQAFMQKLQAQQQSASSQ